MTRGEKRPRELDIAGIEGEGNSVITQDLNNRLFFSSEEKEGAEEMYKNSIIPMFTTPTTKLGGYQFFRDVLKSPKHVVAPMIDHTFLAFRMLCRKYGADLVYTPMFHSKNYATNATYRLENFEIAKEDRPLVVQFCGNEVDYIVQAAKMVESQCDAVDLNLGCPQGIARRGNYGAFLLEKPDVILPMVRALHKELSVPIFCKIRLLPNLDDTIKLALQLQEAGCQLLTVHGRTKEQKGHTQPHANWKAIRAIKEALVIPVIANGSVGEWGDIEECLKETGADGVMSADGILNNPAMFNGAERIGSTTLCREYLEMVKKYPTPYQIVRSHFYKMLKKECEHYEDLRDKLAHLYEMPQFYDILEEIDRRYRENVPKIRTITNKEKREQKKLELESTSTETTETTTTTTDNQTTTTNLTTTEQQKDELLTTDK
ncbi:tRNA-dihydrouridine synthase 1-like protein [Heterostelium album PN500]|uniref:tRNA-dihydrouridine(16/17) synthase [NAD(P)(+)] n=1 Tax=Heterostelium pallidum (strain ATCC 26659 / Pp 5 / PN500) TaxID=670386 RepID=D3BAF6_HETP5|nr:tRNA-dihydrouridine synthase 1-like protein [Heterostelium album PN500]EFA81543.1 tRNA-dihydrouridine synthase 1-like protein [Heterostelium album PN500]|eukprot:XP_020433660.1 tRNA-dihydrouridine synthase 1-like protein [Heterostelium album PN500]